MNSTGRQSIAAVHEVVVTPAPGWDSGPLPLAIPDFEVTATRRAGYFSPACAWILYGTDGEPHRWHRATTRQLPAGTLLGLDLFRPDSARQSHTGFLVAHIETTIPEILGLLRSVAGRRGQPRAQTVPGDLLPGGTMLATGERPFTAAFLTATGTLPDPDSADVGRVSSWAPAQRWLWALASRTTHTDFPPDPDHSDRLMDGTVVFSADWRGLVNRDGAAFVGLRPDCGADDPFFGHAQLYTHTIYLDALLLGMTQRTSIDAMTDAAARSFHAPSLPRHLAALEERAARFRATYWLRTAGFHGHANDVLVAYQTQHQLTERFDLIIREIADLARIVQTEENQQISAALGIITVLGLPLGLALGILQTTGANSPLDLMIALAASLAATAVLFTTRFGRLLARAAIRRFR